MFLSEIVSLLTLGITSTMILAQPHQSMLYGAEDGVGGLEDRATLVYACARG